jgi:hypothetical protein
MDDPDILKHGLRPFIANSNHDFPRNGEFQSPNWARLKADMLFGQHMKLNGTVKCVGIYEPIPVGDNAQIGDVVYHIESVTHMASISPTGTKKFETILQLSSGVDASGENAIQKYAQMDNFNIQDELKKDYKKDQIYPGISDTQFSFSRQSNGDTPVNSVPPKSASPKTIKNKKETGSKNQASIKSKLVKQTNKPGVKK